MNYFVVGEDGQKYGPADVATLNQWVLQGRVNVGTMLEDAATGQPVPASSVAGMAFPMQHGGYDPNSNYPRGHVFAADNGDGDLRTAWIFAIIGLVGSFVFAFCCMFLAVLNVFSILGAVYASKAQKKGCPNTKPAMVSSIVGICLGPALAIGIVAFFNWMK